MRVIVNHYTSRKDHELEDILPADLIESAYNDALRDIFDSPIVFKLNKGKTAASNIKEYIGRNTIDGEIEKELEEKYKINIDEKVSLILKEINRGSNIAEKLSNFKEKLPNYSKFLEDYLQ